MKVGIIGWGKIGKIRQQTVAKMYPETKFYIYEPNLDKKQKNTKFEKFVSSPEKVIKESNYVIICTPNNFNVEYTIKALKSGKSVFCEKPPALNYDELLLVEKEYKKHPQLALVYGFNHRQYDSIQRMKEIIDDEETGKLLWLRGRYGKAMGDPNTAGWRSDPNKSGGGILLDQGIHMLDLMIYFAGGFDEIQAVITNNMWNIDGIEDNAFVNLYNSEKNISASLHSTMIEWRHIFSLEVLLENSYIALNGLKTPSGSYGKEVLTICDDKHNTADVKESRTIEFRSNNTWEKEMKLFFQGAVTIQAKGYTNLPQALEVMKLIKEAYHVRR